MTLAEVQMKVSDGSSHGMSLYDWFAGHSWAGQVTNTTGYFREPTEWYCRVGETTLKARTGGKS